MPYKRRLAKAPADYPLFIQMLLAGADIERTEGNRRELVCACYFGWCENVPKAAQDRAWALLCEWGREEACQ